jgi:hypothetical protein
VNHKLAVVKSEVTRSQGAVLIDQNVHLVLLVEVGVA